MAIATAGAAALVALSGAEPTLSNPGGAGIDGTPLYGHPDSTWIAFADRPRQWPCEAGRWPDEQGDCADAEEVFVGLNGRAFWVNQRHPAASDANPGTRAEPWATIGRATGREVLQPGDAVMIRTGVYRESVRPKAGGTGPEARVTYAAYPGDEVIVTGADSVPDGWRRGPEGWRRTWTGPVLRSYANEPVMRREMVIADGSPLLQSKTERLARAGTFWTTGPDSAQHHLTVRFFDDRPPAESAPEIAVRTHLFFPQAETPYVECGDPSTPGWIRLVGISFEHAANRAQWGAVCLGSRGGLAEAVTVRETNGLGIDVSGENHRFEGVRSNRNGQMGWGGSCRDCLIVDGEAIANNWKGYDPFWEAGGGKWAGTSGTTLRRHVAAGNNGPGIWFDGDNHRNVIENSLVMDNQVAGVMLELNTTETLVRGTWVEGTRWRGYAGHGVLSQAASRNTFHRLTLTRNEGGGLWLRLDPERRAPDGHNSVSRSWIVGNLTRSDVEAREVAVEGTSLEHVRTTLFAKNAIGRRRHNDGVQSVFYVHPVDGKEAGFRSGDLDGWRRWVRDTTSRLTSETPPSASSWCGGGNRHVEREREVGAPRRLLPVVSSCSGRAPERERE